MVRFRVIKGSHILLAFSIAVFAVVLAFMLFFSGQTAKDTGTVFPNTENSAYYESAKVVSAFADSNDSSLKIEIIPDATEIPQKEISVLIYHTHTHEAYEQDRSDPYEAVETWRTLDENHSVVRVGRELAKALTGEGLRVIHDAADHEQNELNSAYVRSLHTLESYTEHFDLYIDLHRDAYAEGLKQCVSDANGTEYAQIMFMIGRGDSYDDALKPDYENNLAFAQRITSRMNREIPDICRNVVVKKGRYNQHIGTPAVLIEIGHNQNTLAQALNSANVLAKVIAAEMKQQFSHPED